MSYTESGNTDTDVTRLQGTSDGYMDNIHALRSQYNADVVVLLIANGNFAGQAYVIEAAVNEAFCVVEDNNAVGNYTFAHEIAHLVGGRHDNDPNGSYEHGYIYSPAYWRTVMALPSPGISRIPFWSSPDITYGGVPMGTTSWNDVRREWNERTPTVAHFDELLPPPPLSVDVTGPSGMYCGQWSSWSAYVTGGSGTITYQWSYILDGSGTWQNLGTSQIQYHQMGTTSFTIRCIVTRGGENANDGQFVTYLGGSCKQGADGEITTALPTEFTLKANYPNPFNPETIIEYGLPEAAEVRLQIVNVRGQTVRNLVWGPQNAGWHNAVWDGRDASRQQVSSGTYLYRITVTSDTGEILFAESRRMLLAK